MIVNKGQCASSSQINYRGWGGRGGTLLFGLHRYVRSQKGMLLNWAWGFLEATFSSLSRPSSKTHHNAFNIYLNYLTYKVGLKQLLF